MAIASGCESALIVLLAMSACVGPPDQRSRTVRIDAVDQFAIGAQRQDVVVVDIRAFAFRAGAFVELEVQCMDSGAGEFAVDDVPPGPLYVQRNREFAVVSGDYVDIGRVVLGRADVAVGEMELSLGLDGLKPWTTGDRLQLYSEGAGSWLALEPAAEPGATLFDVAIAYDGNLVDSTRGDTLWIGQLSTRQLSSGGDVGASYRGLSRSVELDNLVLSGPSVSADADLAPATTRHFDLDLRVRAFDRLRLLEQPVISTSWYDVNVSALDGAEQLGQYGPSADLADMRVVNGSGSDVRGSMEFDDPFPPSWTTVATVVAWYPVTRKVNDGDSPLVLFDSIWIRDGAAQLDGRAVLPRLSAPRNVRVSPKGRVAVVTWETPAEGIAAGYVVSVHSMVSVGAVSRSAGIATLHTVESSVRLPAAMLAPDAEGIVVQIAAISSPVALERRPFALGLPYGSASTTSTMWTIATPSTPVPR